MHSYSTYLPLLLNQPSVLATLSETQSNLEEKPKPKQKQNINKNFKKIRENHVIEAIIWPLPSQFTLSPLILKVFIASGLWSDQVICYASLSLRLLLDILLLSCVIEILLFGVCRTGPFTCSNIS